MSYKLSTICEAFNKSGGGNGTPYTANIRYAGSSPVLTTKLNIMSKTLKYAKKAKAKSCMNNGGCPYCKRNRLHNTNKKLMATTYSLNTINN